MPSQVKLPTGVRIYKGYNLALLITLYFFFRVLFVHSVAGSDTKYILRFTLSKMGPPGQKIKYFNRISLSSLPLYPTLVRSEKNGNGIDVIIRVT